MQRHAMVRSGSGNEVRSRLGISGYARIAALGVASQVFQRRRSGKRDRLPLLAQKGLRVFKKALFTEPFYSITSSTRSMGGIVRPRAFTVLALTINSNLVGCSTGSSPGLAPLR